MKNNEFKMRLTKSQRESVKIIVFGPLIPGGERETDDCSPHTTEEKIGMLWLSYFQDLKNQANPTAFLDKKECFEERCLVAKDLETLLGYFPTEKDIVGLIPDEEKFDKSVIPIISKDLEHIKEALKDYPKLVSTISRLFI